MSHQVWSEYFEGEQLTDYSTVKFEEDRYTTQVIDVSGVDNPQIQTRFVSAESFVLPSEAYLEVEYKIMRTDGVTPFLATDNIALINGWSLFKTAELYYNSGNMETVDNPGTVSHVLGLLEDPEDYKSKGSLEYRFYDTNKQQTWKETAAGANGAAPSDAVIGVPVIPVAAIVDGGGAPALATNVNAYINSSLLPYLDSSQKANKGQEARLARCPPENQSNWIKLKLSDIFGMCKVNKPLRGLNMELRFTKETSFNNCLLRGPTKIAPVAGTNRTLTVEGRVIITKMNLIMPTLKPHLKIFSEINTALNGGAKVPFDYQRIWCNMYPDGQGGAQTVPYTQRILSNTKRPRHLFAVIKDRNRRAQPVAQTLNPMLFDLPTTVKGYVQVGNVRYPALEYDSSQDGFIRLYNAFLNASGKNADALASSFLTFNTWKELYPIMYFDLSHNDNQFELSMDSEVTLNLNITNAPALFDMYAIVISDEHKVGRYEGQILMVDTVDKPGERF